VDKNWAQGAILTIILGVYNSTGARHNPKLFSTIQGVTRERHYRAHNDGGTPETTGGERRSAGLW
jgi:hypothetical protein